MLPTCAVEVYLVRQEKHTAVPLQNLVESWSRQWSYLGDLREKLFSLAADISRTQGQISRQHTGLPARLHTDSWFDGSVLRANWGVLGGAYRQNHPKWPATPSEWRCTASWWSGRQPSSTTCRYGACLDRRGPRMLTPPPVAACTLFVALALRTDRSLGLRPVGGWHIGCTGSTACGVLT